VEEKNAPFCTCLDRGDEIKVNRKGSVFLTTQTQMTKPNNRNITAKLAYFILCFFLASCLAPLSISNGEVESQPVGYGHKVVSARVDPSVNVLTADLQLIKNSSTFGPDIQNLNFIAR